MATSDPLQLLRRAARLDIAPVPFISTTSEDPTADVINPEVESSLALATHLRFTLGPDSPSVSVPLDTATRFSSADVPVDLRSIYFAWTNRDLTLPDYNAAAARLNAEPGAVAVVQTLPFVERVDLYTWLEGATDESDYIRPAAGDDEGGRDGGGGGGGGGGLGDGSTSGAAVAGATAVAGRRHATAADLGRSGRGTLNPRLAAVYNGERSMGDRNTVLRGIKPTDFSHVRKLAAQFAAKKPAASASSADKSSATNDKKTTTTTPTLSVPVSLAQRPARRPDPIILLSPSASSLLRMSNARSFLEGGRFVPADNAASMPNLLHVSRLVHAVDPMRPLRFVLVEGADQFKPEYWNRVVAVFTTGQAWQFKGYRWSSPDELFRRVPGVFVGWRGDPAPESVRSWGPRVLCVWVDRWREGGAATATGVTGTTTNASADVSRFRDKEAAEQIWRMVEQNMVARGWRRDAGPMPM